MSAKLRYQARVLKSVWAECYQEVDGYWVWSPSNRGSWTAEDLKEIARILDAANRKWDAEIQEYFERQRRWDSDA